MLFCFVLIGPFIVVSDFGFVDFAVWIVVVAAAEVVVVVLAFYSIALEFPSSHRTFAIVRTVQELFSKFPVFFPYSH